MPNFSAGGIATPADAALVMQLGAEAIFVGSGIFKSSDPEARARAIVKAATYYNDPAKLLEASEDLGIAMFGIDVAKLDAASGSVQGVLYTAPSNCTGSGVWSSPAVDTTSGDVYVTTGNATSVVPAQRVISRSMSLARAINSSSSSYSK